MNPSQTKLATIGIAKAFKKQLDFFESKVRDRYPDYDTFLKAAKKDPKAVATDILLLKKGRAQLNEMYGRIGIKHSDTTASPSSGTKTS